MPYIYYINKSIRNINKYEGISTNISKINTSQQISILYMSDI